MPAIDFSFVSRSAIATKADPQCILHYVKERERFENRHVVRLPANINTAEI